MQEKAVRYFRPTLLYAFVISTQSHQPRTSRDINFKSCTQCRSAGVLCGRAQGSCGHHSLPADLYHTLGPSTVCGIGSAALCIWSRQWDVVSLVQVDTEVWCPGTADVCWNNILCSKMKTHFSYWSYLGRGGKCVFCGLFWFGCFLHTGGCSNSMGDV